MNVANVVNGWAATAGTAAATVTVTPSQTTIAVNQGLSVTVALNATNGTPTGTMTLAGPGYVGATQTVTSSPYTFTIPADGNWRHRHTDCELQRRSEFRRGARLSHCNRHKAHVDHHGDAGFQLNRFRCFAYGDRNHLWRGRTPSDGNGDADGWWLRIPSHSSFRR